MPEPVRCGYVFSYLQETLIMIMIVTMISICFEIKLI